MRNVNQLAVLILIIPFLISVLIGFFVGGISGSDGLAKGISWKDNITKYLKNPSDEEDEFVGISRWGDQKIIPQEPVQESDEPLTDIESILELVQVVGTVVGGKRIAVVSVTTTDPTPKVYRLATGDHFEVGGQQLAIKQINATNVRMLFGDEEATVEMYVKRVEEPNNFVGENLE